MTQLKDQYYQTHIFICTNQKESGKCCGQKIVAKELLEKLKTLVKEIGVGGQNGIRISQSGCLGRCNEGPCAVIYPQGKWFNLLEQKDEFLQFTDKIIKISS